MRTPTCDDYISCNRFDGRRGRAVESREGGAKDSIFQKPRGVREEVGRGRGPRFCTLLIWTGRSAGFLGILNRFARLSPPSAFPVSWVAVCATEEAVQMAFDAGVSRVVIGTRASESMDFVGAMVKKFGGGRIAVGIDAKNGVVSVKGWMQSGNRRPLDYGGQAEAAGVGTIIYTDIATDGMLEGPNFSEVGVMLKTVQCALVASGGVSKADDVYRLAAMESFYRSDHRSRTLRRNCKPSRSGIPAQESGVIEFTATCRCNIPNRCVFFIWTVSMASAAT